MTLFSRRNNAEQVIYSYRIPEMVRRRLFHTLRQTLDTSDNQHLSLDHVFEEMSEKILQRYGGFKSSGFEAARRSDDPVVEHFFYCTDEELMDFLQMLFETRWCGGGQATVEALNRVLEEENIGFELTPYSETITDGGTLFGLFRPGLKTIQPTLPKVLRKDEKRMHAALIKPCLEVLADSRFATANAELMNAFEECRQQKYGDAITDAGAALESVLKTICTEKRWPYDKHKDTCSKLLDICREQGLFHPFYKPILEGTATIRNKLGDAHGKGPTPEYHATKELAEHMLYTVCNNISMLLALAKL